MLVVLWPDADPCLLSRGASRTPSSVERVWEDSLERVLRVRGLVRIAEPRTGEGEGEGAATGVSALLVVIGCCTLHSTSWSAAGVATSAESRCTTSTLESSRSRQVRFFRRRRARLSTRFLNVIAGSK